MAKSKPITVERLDDTIVRIIDDLNTENKKNEFIRLDNRNTIINQNSIKFIKKDKMKLVFYTDSRTYETYSSFAKISETLPPNFIRCHKSYIANVNKIVDISPNNTILFDNNNGLKCYIGPKYKEKVMEVFKNDRNFTDGLE